VPGLFTFRHRERRARFSTPRNSSGIGWMSQHGVSSAGIQSTGIPCLP
jgi:hypothetical protein